MYTTPDEYTHVPEPRENRRSKRARHLRRAWAVGSLAALCTALSPGVAPYAATVEKPGRHCDRSVTPHASTAESPRLRCDPAYVTNEADDSVTVIDTTTTPPTVIDTITAAEGIGNAPYGVAVDPRRARAYVANFFDDTVSVINTNNNQVVGSPITVGNNPVGVVAF